VPTVYSCPVTTASTAHIWVEWNGVITASDTTTWTVWNHNISTATTNVAYSTDTASVIYAVWDQALRRETPQERQERQIRLELQRTKAEQARVLRDAADKRAERLLLQFLSSDQEVQYRASRYFEVLSKDGMRRYRIRRGWAGNVTVIDPKGREVEQLCIHPNVSVPPEDNLLAQKLLLEADEEKFRRTANITRLAA
jgi:hypothetical protein